MREQWNLKVFSVKEEGFPALALEIFRFQAAHNPVYKAYLQLLKIDPSTVNSIESIPFLPIGFFKTNQVTIDNAEPKVVFESSGTTGMQPSRHFVHDLSLYEDSFKTCFEHFYEPVNRYCVIGLLPSYLERNNSSLVYMVDKLISWTEHPQSGFYLNEWDQLAAVLEQLEKIKQPTLLIGVSFALLDFAEKHSIELKNTIVMETGGMKGRGEEMIREDLHAILKKTFSLNEIHSEYGMTELLSQAYSKGDGIFQCPPWMKVLIRDEEDPLSIMSPGSATISGAINIIDLANIYSCPFIATDDVGKLHPDGRFEVLGRMDESDLRGCSMLVV